MAAHEVGIGGAQRARPDASLPGKEGAVLSRAGYGLIMIAGAGLIGYAGYHAARLLIASSEIGLFFKGLILVVCLGLVLALAGLIWERRKEERHADRDD